MANSTENRIDTTLSAGNVTDIGDGFAKINTALDGTTQALTEDERGSLFSLDVENKTFAEDALKQGQLLFASLPPAMQRIVTNMANDGTLFDQLEKIENELVKPLALRVSDTKRLAAHEKFVGALALYKIIEAFAEMGIEGFQAAYDVLKARFAGQGGRPPVSNP